MKPQGLKPVDMPVSEGRISEYSCFVYFRKEVDVWLRLPKVTIRPAACHVVPEVRRDCSRRRILGTLRRERW